MQRIWPLVLCRRYRIRVSRGPAMMIDGSLFRPWTFPVRKSGREVARIEKKWSGVGRELLSDADTFMVRFLDPSLGAAERRLLIAAALVVDFDFFESDPRGSRLP